ncbi:uncharacterized protein LOC128551618 [Mercenaria mercenaria]|uniref:uncharacterized protein LOC128551618 n=1 Tax=Mercenaria mercenaria TaxID=6596 RepID=UPI00234E6A99|nr:uncharacterized protein LOC128551618 [Mercenaria mercenaria]
MATNFSLNIGEDISLTLIEEQLLGCKIIYIERQKVTKKQKIGIDLQTAQTMMDLSGEVNEIVNKFGDGSVSFIRSYVVNKDVHMKISTCGSSINIDIRRYSLINGNLVPMKVGVSVPGVYYLDFINGLLEMIQEAE